MPYPSIGAGTGSKKAREMKPNTSVLLIGIAYSSYVLLGLPNGSLGVAWPSIRESLGISLDALGTLLAAVTIGNILSSFNSGRVVAPLADQQHRLGSGAAGICCGARLVDYGPVWVVGGDGGRRCGRRNKHDIAANYKVRHINWLHACFGIGVTLGPALMTTLLDLGQSWRWGYVIIVFLQGLLAAFLGLTLDRWQSAEPTQTEANPGSPAGKVRSVDTLKLPLAWLGIAIFAMHTGVQFTAGQWAYSLFTEARSVAPSTAGLWLSIYWGSLTAGRLFLGAVADRVGVVALLRMCIVGIILGSALVWWNVADPVSFLRLALIGFSLAPLFPSLISSTPRQVGAAHAANAIGFQVAAGSVGIALLPGFAGVLVESLGLEIIGSFLFAASVVLLLLHEAIIHLSAGARP